MTTPTPNRYSRPSSTGPGSPSGSNHSARQGNSWSSSQTGTTTSIATPVLDFTRPPTSTSVWPPTRLPNVGRYSMRPVLGIRIASAPPLRRRSSTCPTPSTSTTSRRPRDPRGGRNDGRLTPTGLKPLDTVRDRPKSPNRVTGGTRATRPPSRIS